MIIEDNLGDAMLISELLKDVSLPVHITMAKDGQEAMDMLKKGDGSNGPTPDFVLDLNLPRVKGLDVLAYVKGTPSLRSVHVVVMAGSLKKDDEFKDRSMGGTDYCIKAATAVEMERSRDCLRGHLESVKRNEKSGVKDFDVDYTV